MGAGREKKFEVKPLFNLDLEELVRKMGIKPFSRGVCEKLITLKVAKGDYLIANVDGSEGRKTHWVVLHHDERMNVFEYFYSFGLHGFMEALACFSKG